MLNASNLTTQSTQNDLSYRLNLIYPIVLSLLATIGNAISFIVFNSLSFKNSTSGFFFKFKSLADILNVYIGTLRYTYLAVNGRDPKETGPFWCYFFNMGVYEMDSICSWISVLASLDRLFLVLKPSKYSSMLAGKNQKSRRLQTYSLLITLGVVTIINSSKIIQTYYDHNAKPVPKCSISNSTASDMINLVVTVAVPFALMILSSSVITHSLVFAKQRLARNESSTKNGQSQSKLEKSRGFIKTVLCLDACFLIFNTPRFVCQIINSIKSTTTSSPSLVLALQLSTIFKYSYYSLNLVIYTLTNSLFRHELFLLFASFFQKLSRQVPCLHAASRRQKIYPSNLLSASVQMDKRKTNFN